MIHTGERVVPSVDTAAVAEQLLFLKHRALYEWVRPWTQQMLVLDLGCGEGYGSQILALEASKVVAADYSHPVARHVHTTYAGPRLACLCCEAERLPFAAQSFDVVVSFEVIEHVPNVATYLQEVRRILRPDGTFLVSTPNRRLRWVLFQRPWNPYHRREYDAQVFGRALKSVFGRAQLRGWTAIPEVLEIEKSRVRQASIAGYFRRLAQLFLPTPLHAGMRRLIKSARSRPSSSQPVEDVPGLRLEATHLTPASFFVTDHNLDDCINLIGICAG